MTIKTMSRKETTEYLTRRIFSNTRRMGLFGCFEVTIGLGGSERVDYMTFDSKGIFRCYEVKSSKEDFYSDAKWSFVGHYNYFVLTKEVFEEVKGDIPDGVGAYVNGYARKRAKKNNDVDTENLKTSMIRSLYREFEKSYNSQSIDIMNHLKRENDRLRSEVRDFRNRDITVNRIMDMIRRSESKDVAKLHDDIREII